MKQNHLTRLEDDSCREEKCNKWNLHYANEFLYKLYNVTRLSTCILSSGVVFKFKKLFLMIMIIKNDLKVYLKLQNFNIQLFSQIFFRQ